jgi:DNA adenine methylase
MEIDIERKVTVSKVTRPALRYFGGKFRLSKWILSQFPEHETYVEPFGGAMGVLLNKQPAHFEIYNDLDGEVVNFFRVLRDQPDELIRLIELTPYAREEQLLSFDDLAGVSEVERARRLYVRCWQSHGGGRTQWRTGWRYQINNRRGRKTMDDWNQVDH